MEELVEDWSNWNPMALDYSNENLNKYIDEAGQNVVEKARAPLKPSEMFKKNAAKKNATEYPYLILKKKVNLITYSVANFFGPKHVHKIDLQPNSELFKVFFKDLGSLESALSQLEVFPHLMELHRVGGQEKSKSEYMPMRRPGNKIPDSPKLPAILPTARGQIDLKSRTIYFSENTNKHPEFLVIPIVDSSCYKSGSLLAIQDVKKRYLNVKFEFNLERHGAYVLEQQYEKETGAKPVIQQLRCGRILYRNAEVDDEDVNLGKDDDKEILMSGFEKCVNCQSYTMIVCKICEMPFCGAMCWSILSEQHDQKCGTDQKVEFKEENFMKLFPKSGLPPPRSMVKITAFEQSNVLYVRPADVVSDVAYHRVLSEVWKHSRNVSKLDQPPVCGQIVLYKFEGQVVRAMVLNVDNPKDICVVCIDFGTVEYTDPGKLYKCSDYVSSLPRYATPVKLRGVPTRALTPHLRDAMYEVQTDMVFEIRYHSREYDYGNHMQTAVLIHRENHRALNSFIKKVMTAVEPDLHKLGFKEDFLPHVAAPPGKNIDLIITDNSFLKVGIIYCTPAILAVEITKMQRTFQDYGENIAKAETYAAPKGELCMAKYMGKWCRGVSMELVGDGYPSILFLDYGNIVPIHVTDIRAYPEQFTYPVLTTEYVLMDLPEELTDAQAKHLEKHLEVGAIVTVDEIVKNEENNYSLRIEGLQKLLS